MNASSERPFYVSTYAYDSEKDSYGDQEVGVFATMDEVIEAIENLKNYRVWVYGPKRRMVYLTNEIGPGQR